MTSIERYFQASFFTDLGGANPPEALIQSIGEQLRALYNVTCPPALGGLLAFCVDPPDACLGEFCPWPQSDWLAPADDNAFEHAMMEPFRLYPLFANTLAVGSTGSGDLWVVALEQVGQDTQVFLCEHDNLYAIHVVADSIPSFAFLNHVIEQQDAAAEDLAALDGRVALRNDLELDPPPQNPFRSGLRIDAVYEHGRGLADHLNGEWLGKTPDALPERLVEDVAGNRIALPAQPLTVMWTLFFTDDGRLRGVLDASAEHPARVVRDSASLLDEILRGRSQVGQVEDIFDLRRRAQQA